MTFFLALEFVFFFACSSSMACLTGVSVKTLDFPFRLLVAFSFLAGRLPNGWTCSALDVDAIVLSLSLNHRVDCSSG